VLFIALAALSTFALKTNSAGTSKEIRGFWQRINFVKRLMLLFTNKRLQSLMVISTCFTLAVDIFYEFDLVFVA
jgi:hypothetical protein